MERHFFVSCAVAKMGRVLNSRVPIVLHGGAAIFACKAGKSWAAVACWKKFRELQIASKSVSDNLVQRQAKNWHQGWLAVGIALAYCERIRKRKFGMERQ
jgi:hypothetical protein